MTIPILPLVANQSLTWTDRRPIGQYYFEVLAQNYNLNDPVQVTAYKTATKADVSKTCDYLVANNCQGLVFWDGGLEDVPNHPNFMSGVNYSGDPENWHPIIDEMMDELSEICISKGIRVGFCIRHGELVRNLRGDVVRVQGDNVMPMIRRSNYARTRCNMSIVYEDSNQEDLGAGTTTDGGKAFLAESMIPNTLIIWEQTNGYWNEGFQYWDCRLSSNAPVPPNAGTILAIDFVSAVDGTQHAALVALAKAGHIFWIQNAWWQQDPSHAVVFKIIADSKL